MRRVAPASLALALPLAASLCTLEARATGLCEGESTSRELAAINEAAGELLERGVRHSCEEVDDGERWEDSPYADVLSFAGKALRSLPEADARGIPKGFVALPAPQAGAKKELEVFLSSREGLLRSKSAQGPAGACSVSLAVGETVEEKGSFPSEELGLRLQAGKRTLHTLALGSRSAGESGTAVKAVFLPTRRALLLWFALPTCGGPPPGYFGEDDGGDCMVDLERTVQLIRAQDVPQIAACFAPGGAAPTGKAAAAGAGAPAVGPGVGEGGRRSKP